MKKVILILVCMFCMAGIWADHLVGTAECGCPIWFMTSGPNMGKNEIHHDSGCLLNKPETIQNETEKPVIKEVIYSNPNFSSSDWYNDFSITFIVTDNDYVRDLQGLLSGTYRWISLDCVDISSYTERKYIYKPDKDLPDGEYTLTVKAKDWYENQSEEISIDFKIDRTKPTVNIQYQEGFKTNEYNNASQIVTLTVTDNVNVNQLFIDGVSTPLDNNKATYVITKDGDYKISCYAFDGAGNQSETVYIEMKIDKSDPEIVLDNDTDEWEKSLPTILVKDKNLVAITVDGFSVPNSEIKNDIESGLKCAKLSLSSLEDLKNFEGEKVLQIMAKDTAGNVSTKSQTIKIDKSSPEIKDFCVYYNTKEINGNSVITSYTVEATITDSLSGVKSIQEGKTLISSNSYSKTTLIVKNDWGNTKKYTLKATDNVGNESIKEFEITFPNERTISTSNVKNNNNTLTLWNIGANEEVTIMRKFLTESNYITTDNFTNFFDAKLEKKWSELIKKIDKTNLLYDEKAKYYYLCDDLGPFGHKEIEYTITVEVNNPYPKSESETDKSCNEKYIARLTNPLNNLGSMKFRIVSPIDNSQYIEFSSDKTPTKEEMETKNIKLGDDGSCLFQFQINDTDAEPYHCELRETDNDGNSSILLTLREKDFFEKNCTHNGEIDNDTWYQFDNNIQLFSANNENPKTVIFVWDEGFSNLSEKGFSQKIPLIAKPDDSGGFTLGLSDAYQAGTKIYATVNHTIELWVDTLANSNLDTQTLQWDFGDNTVVTGAKVSHAYRQAENRTGNTSEYTLNIKSGNTLKKSISMLIKDTQAGELLGNEEWIGEHFLTGEVIVPNGKSLTISKNNTSKSNETVIQCVESSREKERGRLSINKEGTLFINTDVPFISRVTQNTSAKTSDLMWSGINIAGTINGSGRLDVSGAQRGLTFQPDASINLKDITIKITDCLCGVHIIANLNGIGSNKSPVWGNGEISNNREYGVKIEANATNVKIADFTGMKVSNNGKDFYKDGTVTVINGGE